MALMWQAGLKRFTAALLAPHTQRLLGELNATAGARPKRGHSGETPSDFLGRLSKVPSCKEFCQ